MRILFLNWACIIKYGMALGFEKEGHQTRFILPHEDNVEGMMKAIDEFKPDFLLTEGGIGREGVIFEVIERSGVPHIYWAIEDPVSSNLSIGYGRRSALVLTTCEEWLEQIYAPNGIPAICVPFACSDWHRKGSHSASLAHSLVFYGNNYSTHKNRLEGYNSMFVPFVANNYDIVFYGSEEWTNPSNPFNVPKGRYRGYLANESLQDLCASSKFILGVHSIDGSRTMQSMRTFEVLGCGGFFLTQHSMAIETMFENHKHLVWSKSPKESLELFDYYSRNAEAMQKIREEGMKFVHENHTYAHRVRDIAKKLKELRL